MTDPAEKWRRAYADMQAELLESGVLDDESLRALRGDVDIETTAEWVTRQGLRMIAVVTPEGRGYPSFQFTPSGDLRAELARPIATLQDAGYSPWMTWVWLVSPATLLSGAIPAQVLVDTPARGIRAVQRHAAYARLSRRP